MRKLRFLIVFLITAPAWSQVQPSATGDLPADDDTYMTPPLLASGMLYPTTPYSQERSNYVSATVTATAAYIDNVLPSSTVSSISDTTVSILPTFSINRIMPRQQETFTYSPVFTYYNKATGLNRMDQSANGTFQGRLSPHVTLGFRDSFIKTSNVFNTSYPYSAGGITGSLQTPVSALIVPFADQIANLANVGLSYQFSSQSMVGVGCLFSTYRYPDQSQSTGLYDSNGTGGSVFYNRRLARTQYAGVMYEYNDTSTTYTNSSIDTQIHSVLPFYALSFSRRFSLSASAGGQRVKVAAQTSTNYRSWKPVGIISFGWQGEQANIAASYLHTIIDGQGLAGAFNSDSANLSAGWQFVRDWAGTAAFSYQSIGITTSVAVMSYTPGNTQTAAATLRHTIGEHFSIECQYAHLHENYDWLAMIYRNPDSNRESITLTYSFAKPLGR